MISETSIQLRSQVSLGAIDASLDSNGNRIPPLGLTQVKDHGRQKPRFIEFTCSHLEVFIDTAYIYESSTGPQIRFTVMSH